CASSECRCGGSSYACREPAHHPTTLLRGLSDWFVGASPRLDPGQSCGSRALFERAKPDAVLGTPGLRADCGRYPDHCRRRGRYRLLCRVAWLDLVAEEGSPAASGGTAREFLTFAAANGSVVDCWWWRSSCMATRLVEHLEG